MTREDAARKVRALRNTAAPGSGATGPERETANRLANQLVAAHGLDRPAPAARPAPFTINVGDYSFEDISNELYQRAMRDALHSFNNMKDLEALEAKRKIFRDILNGTDRSR